MSIGKKGSLQDHKITAEDINALFASLVDTAHKFEKGGDIEP